VSGLEYLIFGLLSNFAVCRKLNIPDLDTIPCAAISDELLSGIGDMGA
jgi:hypothetical protein